MRCQFAGYFVVGLGTHNHAAVIAELALPYNNGRTEGAGNKIKIIKHTGWPRPGYQLAFVACDGNATLLSVDLNAWQVTGSHAVGADPDVLAYDPPHTGYTLPPKAATSPLWTTTIGS